MPRSPRHPVLQTLEALFYAAVRVIHMVCGRAVRAVGWLVMEVQGWFPIPVKLAAGFLALSVMAWLCGTYAPGWLVDGHEEPPQLERLGVLQGAGQWLYQAFVAKQATIPNDFREVIEGFGYHDQAERYLWLGRGVAALCALAVLAAFLPVRFSLWVMKAAWAAFAVFWVCLIGLLWSLPADLYDYDYQGFWKGLRNEVWVEILFRFGPLSLIPTLVLVGLVTKAVHERYRLGKQEAKRGLGDRVFDFFRSGGRDPKYRNAWAWTIAGFLLVLIYPFLLRSCGMEEPYGLPPGSGNPVVEMVKIKQEKKKKKKKLIVNKWSPFIFERMKIDDLQVMVELEKETRDQYQVSEQQGKLGKGGGKTGGWPGGMANSKLRFIRLKYSGGDWDQDMGKGADYNMLVYFHRLTGFPIAPDTEYKEAARLRRFPQDHAPPFIFITGKQGVSFSTEEIKTLRWYCLEEGGMLFIDNGGGSFDRNIRGVLRKIFPDKSLIDIANDDPIFKAPFTFPNGAPPLWQHSGTRAMGIRADGRWVVFYHQGDINDAWKDGHSGASDAAAEQAYRMGINVIYYAFNEYHRLHFE